MSDLINIFLHLDDYLSTAISDYGIWIYLIFFLIIFLETGLVIAPFLPGDSLIFIVGTFAAVGALDIGTLFVVMTTAAILGDTLNYFIGHHVGKRALEGKVPYIKKEHLDKTYEFYKKYGNITIVLARFIPVIRSCAPFIAGIVKMNYRNFAFYNVTGGILWVASFLTLGYFLGSIPLVKDNLETIILLVILASLLPIAGGFLRGILGKRARK